MSWLSERKCHYEYKCPDGHTTIQTATVADEEEMRHDTACAECGKSAQYAGSEIDDGDKLRQVSKVTYEQNGRKAIRIRGKNGEIQHISATKAHYMKTGRIEPQYTKEFQEKLVKEKAEQMLATEHNQRRATSTTAKFKEMLKDMPDGEYTSDGQNVKQIK